MIQGSTLIRVCVCCSLILYALLVTLILEQVSVTSLEQALTSTGVNENIKAFIYKSRAQYLEEMHHTKRIA